MSTNPRRSGRVENINKTKDGKNISDAKRMIGSNTEMESDSQVKESETELDTSSESPNTGSQRSKRPTSLAGMSSHQTDSIKLKPPPQVLKVSKSPNRVTGLQDSDSKSSQQTVSTGAIPKKPSQPQEKNFDKNYANLSPDSPLTESELLPDEFSDTQYLSIRHEKSKKTGRLSPSNIFKQVKNLMKSPRKSSGNAESFRDKGYATRSKTKSGKNSCQVDSDAKETDKKRQGATLEPYKSPKRRDPLLPSIFGKPIEELCEIVSNSDAESGSFPTQNTEDTSDGISSHLVRLSTSSVPSLEFQNDLEQDEAFQVHNPEESKSSESAADDKGEYKGAQ